LARRIIFTSFILLCSLGCWLNTSGARAGEERERDLEYKVKAAFLVNFVRLISWPAPAFVSAEQPLTLCLVGDDLFGSAFAGIESKRIRGRRVQVRKFSDFSSADQCHLIFVAGNAEPELAGYLAHHESAAQVTVGESEGFASRGGMIEFFRRSDDRLSFKINHGVARKHKLYVEASLLDLAAEVY